MYLVFFCVIFDYLDESPMARFVVGTLVGICAVRQMFGG